MIFAAAQTKPKRAEIESNLEDHYNLIELASSQGAGLIVFPEMSITGYERERARGVSFNENDSRLAKLRKLSGERQIIVVAGAPVIIKNELYIGSFVIKPDNSVLVYTKQFLHPGEDIYFKSSFGYYPVTEIGSERISLAVCADINNPAHPENANKAGTTVYLASIFFEPDDMIRAYKTLEGYAIKYSMNVLMSNFAGQSWGLDSGGKSGFWNKNGELVACLNDTDSGLLLVKKISGGWIEKLIIYT